MATETDKVVREIDVYSSKSLWGNTTQLCLFQYPLRPLWRPYEIDESSTMRVKPVAKRVEMTVPLDVRGENYNEDAPEALKLKHLTLQSRPGHLPTSYALGSIRGNKLLLMPIDQAVQMRPHMAHLDEPAAKPSQEVVKEEEPVEELVALQVQVQRRETERQTQMRLNSHAYLSKLEADEPWTDIRIRDLSHDPVAWGKLESGPKDDLPMHMSRAEYLAALLPAPAASRQAEEQPSLAEAHRSILNPDNSQQTLPPPSHSNGVIKSEPGGQEAAIKLEDSGPALPEEELKAMKKALGDLYRHGAVFSLRSVRAWLTEVRPSTALARVGGGTDAVLHGAILQTGLTRQQGGFYIHAITDNSEITKFRKVLLDLLAAKSSVKKAEVVKAAAEVGLDLADAQYSKALKEVCQSKGAQWSLKESTFRS